jgi:hypothetical protein
MENAFTKKCLDNGGFSMKGASKLAEPYCVENGRKFQMKGSIPRKRR